MQEHIFKGATRPPMKFGIPLVPLVVITAAMMLSVIWGISLVSGWTAPVVLGMGVPLLAWMRLTTRRDDQRLRQMFILAKLALSQRNQRLWCARTYCSVQWTGTSHAYRQ